jgi:hypothetical protein
MSTQYKSKQKAGSTRKKNLVYFFLVFLVLILVFASGCLKLMQQSTGNNTRQPSDALDPIKTVDTTVSIIAVQKNSPSKPTLSVPPAQSCLVTDASPILPPDLYPIQHGARINATPENNLLNRLPEFTRTYTLNGNATGMIVNVVKGPLIISFDVNPLYDCLENPDSCRGNLATSVNRPWMTITVRDNQTRGIVAEDGYAREYSSQQNNRTIKIFGDGQYHITLTGAYLDVTLSIITGASPSAPGTQPLSANPAPTRTLSPEYLHYLRQSGSAL